MVNLYYIYIRVVTLHPGNNILTTIKSKSACTKVIGFHANIWETEWFQENCKMKTNMRKIINATMKNQKTSPAVNVLLSLFCPSKLAAWFVKSPKRFGWFCWSDIYLLYVFI
jgi:hypothetical protein